MKKVLDLLYKDKAPEDRPKICVIKTKSTVMPDEQLTYEQWAAEYRVGIAWYNNGSTDNAHNMMSLYDDAAMSEHIKNKK
jgi:hypothetical protein